MERKANKKQSDSWFQETGWLFFLSGISICFYRNISFLGFLHQPFYWSLGFLLVVGLFVPSSFFSRIPMFPLVAFQLLCVGLVPWIGTSWPGFASELALFHLFVVGFSLLCWCFYIRSKAKELLSGFNKSRKPAVLGLCVLGWIVGVFLFPYLGARGHHAFLVAWTFFVGMKASEKLIVRVSFSSAFCGLFLLACVPFPKNMASFTYFTSTSAKGVSLFFLGRKLEEKNLLLVTAGTAVLLDSFRENRLAEVMVHPAMSVLSKKKKRILVVGGERRSLFYELGKYDKEIHEIVHLPLDELFLHLFDHPFWARLMRFPELSKKYQRLSANEPQSLKEVSSLLQPFKKAEKRFDMIVFDVFPATWNLFLHKKASFRLLLSLLKKDGLLLYHGPSPYQEPKQYWCSLQQWSEEKVYVLPFQLAPVQFFDAGFALVSKQRLPSLHFLKLRVQTKFLTKNLPFHLFQRFSKESQPVYQKKGTSCFPVDSQQGKR